MVCLEKSEEPCRKKILDSSDILVVSHLTCDHVLTKGRVSRKANHDHVDTRKGLIIQKATSKTSTTSKVIMSKE